MVAVLIVQGVAMLVFSVATYKRKLWGACGLGVVVVLVGAMWLMLSRAFNGVLPLLVYASAGVSIHRARARTRGQSSAPELDDSRSCPHCGARYMLSDYRTDVPSIVCANCAGLIARSEADRS